jgi:hypothetical protein
VQIATDNENARSFVECARLDAALESGNSNEVEQARRRDDSAGDGLGSGVSKMGTEGGVEPPQSKVHRAAWKRARPLSGAILSCRSLDKHD